MAAAIAFLTTKQQDKVSLAMAQDGLKRFERPLGSFTHLVGVLKAMEEVAPAGQAQLADALRQVANMTGRRGLLVVFSDLLDDFDDVMQALSVFTHRGSEVILFHVLHADELHLPDLHAAVFQDSETSQRVSLNVQDVRGAYDKRLHAFLAQWHNACRGRGIDYNLVSTATPYQKALEHYLFSRASMM